MIRSMTGFGRSAFQEGGKAFSIELKGVNQRYLDVKVKIPREYNYMEDLIKKEVSHHVSRGRIEVFLRYDGVGESGKQVVLDINLAKAYLEAIKSMQQQLEIQDDVTLSYLAKQPDVLIIQDVPEDPESMQALLREALQAACQEFVAMREAEGQHLAANILEKLQQINQIVQDITVRAPKVVTDYHKRLQERIAELIADATTIDPQRIAMEVAIFADRSTIDEEIVRLGSHIQQFESMVHTGGVVGRKLDFLLQEMNREINTIGSKANDVELSQLVVEVKAILENIREQVQNIE